METTVQYTIYITFSKIAAKLHILDIGKTNEAEQFWAHWHTNDGGIMGNLCQQSYANVSWEGRQQVHEPCYAGAAHEKMVNHLSNIYWIGMIAF